MKFTLLPVIAALSLSACGATTAPLKVTAEPARIAYTKAAPKSRIRNTGTLTTVRAYQTGKTESGKTARVEVAAECLLTSDHLRANLSTPQGVRLPKYDQIAKLEDRGVPPSILVECKKDGKSGKALLAAKPGQIVSGSGNLAADLILIAGSAAVASVRDWSYENLVSVDLK